MKIASDEAEVDSAEQDSFIIILFLLRSVFQINWPPNYVMEMQMKLQVTAESYDTAAGERKSMFYFGT